MLTARFSGRISCMYAPPCHACPPPCTPPSMHTPFHACPLCHACPPIPSPCKHGPFATHIPTLPCIPPSSPYMPPSPHTPLATHAPPNRMTDACENITTVAGGKNKWKSNSKLTMIGANGEKAVNIKIAKEAYKPVLTVNPFRPSQRRRVTSGTSSCTR